MLLSKTIHSPNISSCCATLSYKVKSNCMKVISAFFFLLFFQAAFSQYNWKELDENLEAKKKWLGNNLVALIWKDDSLVYKKEIGDFTAKTQAPIASCSKWLTAALVMKFVEEGKLSLDDNVSKYIPEFEKYFKGYITIRQCLSHTTGIEDEGGLAKKLFKRKKFNTLEDEVNDFAARDIRAKPGTDFWYGNIGLNIAGRVLEVISRRKFDQLIRSKLLYPLGMRKTTFQELNGGPVNPSGGAKSTAEDYMKFLVMLLNRGKHNGVQVLSEASVQEMLKLQTTTEMAMHAPGAAEGYGYASGCWVMEKDAAGNGTVVTSPGLFGTWPVVDYCRGYAYLIFVKNFLGEERANEERSLKNIIDHQITKNDCK